MRCIIYYARNCVAMQAYVRVQADPETAAGLEADGGRLRCPAIVGTVAQQRLGAGRRCQATPYSAAMVASTVSEETFAIWEAARVRLAEREAIREVQEGHQRELDRLRMQLANNGVAGQADGGQQGQEGRAEAHKQHIIDNLLTLRCPNQACRAAFLDFTGCMALKCHACSTAFCGYCESCHPCAVLIALLIQSYCFTRPRTHVIHCP